jgi:peptidoglycan/LPS O-acetylase OafA/YrhL
VLGCGAIALIVGGDVLVGLGLQVVGAATFSSNWLAVAQGADYFDGTTPELFRNLWSLAVEEQFYVVWPAVVILLLLVPRRWMRVVLVLAVAAASATAMALGSGGPVETTRVYYGTDTHAFGLALGAALAILLAGRFRGGPETDPRRGPAVVAASVGALAVAAIILVALTLPADDPFVTRGGLVLVAVLTALAIAGATTAGSWLGRGLDIAPLRWVGERSYGLYLWHWPVWVLLVATLPEGTAAWVAPVVATAVTVAAAALSYRLVEQPVRRLGFRGALTATPRGMLTVAAVSLAGALTVSAIAVAPSRGEAQVAIEAGAASLAGTASADGRGHSLGPRRPAPLPTGDQIYAIGDSVMLAAAPWLQERLPGIAIDAEVSRSMWTAPTLVQSAVDAGVMRPILVLGLATNGDVDPADLAEVVRILGPDRLLILVNGQAPRDWIPIGNQTLAEFARHLRQVDVANWHDAIAPQLYELASDEVHPGGPISGGIYVAAICDALQRIAELPPRRDLEDLRGVDQPV